MKVKDTRRTSFDLTVENAMNLKVFSEKIEKTYSWVVNYMLGIFFSAKPEIKNELAEFCDRKIDEISQNMDLMSEFEKQDLRQKKIQYQEFSYFFREGKQVQWKKENGMRKVFLKEGYLLIPEDWIVLDNYSNPADHMYAGVVETREPLDGKKKYNANHFVYFSDYKYCNEYPSDMKDAIYIACCEKDKEFKNVLNAVVSPVYEGKNIASNMINLEAYKAAPCPGLFHVVEQGDPMYWKETNLDYEPPYGAMIIR